MDHGGMQPLKEGRVDQDVNSLQKREDGSWM